MHPTRIALAFAAPLALAAAAWSAPASAQGAARAEFEQAMLAQLNESTRAAVQSRATGGNSVMSVIGTMLLNNYYESGARSPGDALTVVAVDFARGVAVLKREPSTFEVVQFDTQTLRIRR